MPAVEMDNGHLADCCFKCGIPFLPPSDQTRIQQHNLAHGDKPEEPLPCERISQPPAPRFKDLSAQQQPTPAIANVCASPPVITDVSPSATALETRLVQAFADGNPPAAEQIANLNELMTEFHSEEVLHKDNTNHMSTPIDPVPFPADQSLQVTTSSNNEPAFSPVITDASSVPLTQSDFFIPSVNNIATQDHSCPVCSFQRILLVMTTCVSPMIATLPCQQVEAHKSSQILVAVDNNIVNKLLVRSRAQM